MKTLFEINEGLHSNVDKIHRNLDVTHTDVTHVKNIGHTDKSGRLEMDMFKD